MPYLTPDHAPGTTQCRVLFIPADSVWLALVGGALSELTKDYNFEQFGTATVSETVERFLVMLDQWEDCPPMAGDLAIIQEQKASGTNGGAFTAGAWQTRPLSAITVNEGSHVSLSGSNFILQPGSYRLRGFASAASVAQHRCRLRNITDALIYLGSSEYTTTTATEQGRSTFTAVFSITDPKTFTLEHFCANTQPTIGLGIANNLGTEIYAEIEILRLGDA